MQQSPDDLVLSMGASDTGLSLSTKTGIMSMHIHDLSPRCSAASKAGCFYQRELPMDYVEIVYLNNLTMLIILNADMTTVYFMKFL